MGADATNYKQILGLWQWNTSIASQVWLSWLCHKIVMDVHAWYKTWPTVTNTYHHGSVFFCSGTSQYGHLGYAIGYWPEGCLGHVYIVLEPVGSARLTFDDDIVLAPYWSPRADIFLSRWKGQGHCNCWWGHLSIGWIVPQSCIVCHQWWFSHSWFCRQCLKAKSSSHNSKGDDWSWASP